jgi:hypothetical protein
MLGAEIGRSGAFDRPAHATNAEEIATAASERMAVGA